LIYLKATNFGIVEFVSQIENEGQPVFKCNRLDPL